MLCINQKTGPLEIAVEKAELRGVKKDSFIPGVNLSVQEMGKITAGQQDMIACLFN